MKNYILEKTEFGYVNPSAKVVIVGITPGNSQLENSRDGLTLREIKRINAFGGNMRQNLIRMLDYIGVNHLLGIASCSTLWEEDFDLVEMTSLLKDATFVVTNKNGEVSKTMFKDVKQINKVKSLQQMFREGFVRDCASYKKTILYIGLGPGVYDMLCKLKEEGIINAEIIALAHPSGANAGRIACYLGTKTPKDASYQWCLDMAEDAIRTVSFLKK